MSNRVVRSSQVRKENAEVDMSLSIRRLNAKCFVIFHNRFINLSALAQNAAQIVMCGGEIRLQADRFM